MYIERESRRQHSTGKSDSQAQANYMSKCLDLITNYLVEIIPQIYGKSSSDCLKLFLAVEYIEVFCRRHAYE